jgi:hypothetical protein
MEERRGELRVRTHALVICIFENQPHRFRLRDISLGGALLERGEASEPPPTHTMIVKSGHKWIKLLARVAWSAPGFHAVRFVAQTEVERLELGEIIDGLASPQARSA